MCAGACVSFFTIGCARAWGVWLTGSFKVSTDGQHSSMLIFKNKKMRTKALHHHGSFVMNLWPFRRSPSCLLCPLL